MNHVEQPDVPVVAVGDSGHAESTKIALLLLKEEINKPLRRLEDYLNEMPGILSVFDLETSPDYTSLSVWDNEFPMKERVACSAEARSRRGSQTPRRSTPAAFSVIKPAHTTGIGSVTRSTR